MEGQLTKQQKEDLELVAYKCFYPDYRSFYEYESIVARFRMFAEATQVCSKWLMEDASDRHACRLRLIQDFNDRIDINHVTWSHDHEYSYYNNLDM